MHTLRATAIALLTVAVPAHQSAAAPQTHAAPSASAFAREFVAVSNAYSASHRDSIRFSNADCVEPSAGHYMCSYATTRPGDAQRMSASAGALDAGQSVDDDR